MRTLPSRLTTAPTNWAGSDTSTQSTWRPSAAMSTSVAGLPTPPVGVEAELLDHAVVEQLAHDGGHRRPREPGDLRQVGPRRRPAAVQRGQQEAAVEPAGVFGCGHLDSFVYLTNKHPSSRGLVETEPRSRPSTVNRSPENSAGSGTVPPVLILGIIAFGMGVGALAQLILGRRGSGIDWGMALGAGLIGSFVGGLLASLIAGDGLAFKPSGLIGSFIGAVLVTLAWRWWQSRHAPAAGARRPPPPLSANVVADPAPQGVVGATSCRMWRRQGVSAQRHRVQCRAPAPAGRREGRRGRGEPLLPRLRDRERPHGLVGSGGWSTGCWSV